jgi:hypothetical protein
MLFGIISAEELYICMILKVGAKGAQYEKSGNSYLQL